MGPYPGVSRETTQLAGRQIDRHPDLPRLERRGFANISLRTQVSAVLDRFVLWRSVQLRPLLSCCTRARRTCGQELNNVQLTCRARRDRDHADQRHPVFRDGSECGSSQL